MCSLASEFLHGQGETTLPTMKPEGKGGAKKETVAIDFSKVKVEPLFEDEVDFDTFSKSDFRAVKIKSCEEVKKSDKLLKFVLPLSPPFLL